MVLVVDWVGLRCARSETRVEKDILSVRGNANRRTCVRQSFSEGLVVISVFIVLS